MKKEYIIPELEVVKIMTTGMLATSLLLDNSLEIDAEEKILAPEMPDLDSYFDNDEVLF